MLYEADCIVFVTAGRHDKLFIHQTGGQVCSAEGRKYEVYWESPPASKFGLFWKGMRDYKDGKFFFLVFAIFYSSN